MLVMKDFIKRAHEFISEKHKDQKRKFTNQSYINHIEETAQLLWEYYQEVSDDELVAALLHDAVEDTETESLEIGKLFGGNVMQLVKEVTNDEKERKKVGAKAYMSNKINNMSEKAFSIKLCDRLSNVLALYNSEVPDDFIKYYGNQTIYIILNLNREVTTTQRQIIDRISATLNYLALERNIIFKGV